MSDNDPLRLEEANNPIPPRVAAIKKGAGNNPLPPPKPPPKAPPEAVEAEGR